MQLEAGEGVQLETSAFGNRAGVMLMAKNRLLPSPLGLGLGGKAEGWVRGKHPHAHPSVMVLQLVPVLMCQRDLIGVGGKSAPGMSQGMGMGLSSCKMGLPMV